MNHVLRIAAGILPRSAKSALRPRYEAIVRAQHNKYPAMSALTGLFPKWANLRQCANMALWDLYVDSPLVEAGIEREWTEIIWPVIQGFDFTTVLELAPGGGRNTARLAALATDLYAVDLNQPVIDRVRARFKEYQGRCRLHFATNDGSTLPMIRSNTITTIYSWDSVVHFDRRVVQDYVREFARVLAPGGRGFVHHSNLGDPRAKRLDQRPVGDDIWLNPQCRSDMTKDLFREYCEQNSLTVEQIDLPWPPWDYEQLRRGEVIDCLSVFSKPQYPR
jgi:SAM-dependent methyltransferase